MRLQGCSALFLTQGYLKQARVRPDMFTNEQIAAVFCNIEQVYAFHQQLLQQLEECYQQHDSKASLIGSVFLNNVRTQCTFTIFHEDFGRTAPILAESFVMHSGGVGWGGVGWGGVGH